MMRQKLKIGEFSRMMQVTVKTLRHYEQLGLLMPDEVDEWTGYRYYRLEQMQKLNAIRRLKGMGFSLDEIRELYEGDSHSPTLTQLMEKVEACERQLQQLLLQREQLLSVVNSHQHVMKMEKFEIQSLPAIIVASHREVIPNYEALGPLCVNVIGPEMNRLGCQCAPTGYCYTIEHGKEYRPTDIDIEYCEEVTQEFESSAIVQCRHLPAVPAALCMKHYGPYNRFYESFTEVFRYIDEHGYRIAGQPRTVYVDGIWNQEDPEKWLSIIQVPIEQ